MGKKRVWEIGCAIFLILFVCTLLSIKIQELMLIEVKVTYGEEINESERSYPISCFREDGGIFYCVVEKSGSFRKEYVVEEKMVSVIRIEGENIVIAGDIFWGDDFERPLVVYDSTHPLKEGDIVEIDTAIYNSEEEEQQQILKLFEEQKKVLLFGIPICIVVGGLLILIWKDLSALHDKNWKKGARGFVLFGVMLLICFIYGEFLQIPREMLPKEHIFDIGFYIDK